jgi:hypothetical protein
MGGYVYLVCDPANDTFKIGVTRDIQSNRFKKLQTGNSTELHVVNIYQCDYPFRLEKMLHFRFSPKHTLNEWFTLDSHDVSRFNDICEETNNILKAMLSNPFFEKNIR